MVHLMAVKQRRFTMSVIIDGDVSVDDEFTLAELNEHLDSFTNRSIKEQIAHDLDVDEKYIKVESKYFG